MPRPRPVSRYAACGTTPVPAAMAGQIERLQQEITQARRQTGIGTEVSFRHLGPKVEQILTLVEEQAEQIKTSATDDIAVLEIVEAAR